MARKIWNYIQSKKILLRACSFLYNLFMLNQKCIRRGNSIKNQGAFLKRTQIKICGKNNRVILEKGVRLQNCRINMSGNNAILHIGPRCYAEKVTFHFEDNGTQIYIGEHCILNGGELAAVEDGCKITVGKDCLFSKNVHLVTTDSHSIIDMDTQKRINPGRDVTVGDHVWLAADVHLLKGATVANNCVVGRGAIVTKNMDKENCVIAGCPARYVKENTGWKAERI